MQYALKYSGTKFFFHWKSKLLNVRVDSVVNCTEEHFAKSTAQGGPEGVLRKTSHRKKEIKISWLFPKCSVTLKIIHCCLDNHCRPTLCNNSFQRSHIWVIKLAHDRCFWQKIFLVLLIWAGLNARKKN